MHNAVDLVCIQLDGQRIENSQTFHAHDPKWKLEILSKQAHDTRGIQPPLQFAMAKSKHLTLPNEVMNSGLLVLSDDDEEQHSQYEEEELNDAEQDGGTVIEILDLTGLSRPQRQKLNKVKVLRMQKQQQLLRRRSGKRKLEKRRTEQAPTARRRRTWTRSCSRNAWRSRPTRPRTARPRSGAV